MRIEHGTYANDCARNLVAVAVPTSKFEKEVLYQLKYRWIDDASFSYKVTHLIDSGKAERLLPKKFRWAAEALYYLYADSKGVFWNPSNELVLGVAKYCHSRKNKILRLAAWNRRHHDTIISIDSYKKVIHRGGFNVYYTEYDDYCGYLNLFFL